VRFRVDLCRVGRVGSVYRTSAYSAFAANDHEQFVQYFWEPFFQRCDANNLLSQLWTWEQGNISDNPLYKGDFEAALKAIKARTIILPVDTDRYFPPVDAEYEAQHIPNSACRVVKSAWGHMAPINAGDISGFDTALAELLDG
jgi:homoserine O-acetyltransferase